MTTKPCIAVLSALGRQAPLDRSTPVRTLEFAFPRSAKASELVIARHKADSRIYVVSTLGGISQSLLVSIVDSHPDEVAETLANIEDIDRDERRLRHGSYVETRDTALARDLGWVAFQLLGIEGTGPTSGYPHQIRVEQRLFECLWAIPLTEEDLAVRKQGLASLLDRFTRLERNHLSLSLA